MLNRVHNLKSFVAIGLYNFALLRFLIDIRKKKKTFLSWQRLHKLVDSFRAISNRPKLRIAEFGVGRGGSAMLLAWLGRQSGAFLSLYDLFERIPPPGERDGDQAHAHYTRVETGELGVSYYGNIPDLMTVIRKELLDLVEEGQFELIAGRFEVDLRQLGNDGRIFDLVHLDCDWYESTRAVLSYLETRLNKGAVIQIDDYAFWPGTKQAVDECAWLRRGQWKQVDMALVVNFLE